MKTLDEVETSSLQEQLEEAENESFGWNRILCNYQGQETGWNVAAAVLLDQAADAWKNGREQEAVLLRSVSSGLKSHVKLAEMKQEATDAYRKQIEFEQQADKLRARLSGG